MTSAGDFFTMRSTAAAFLLLLLATGLSAQQLSEQITVNVVEVPVYVSRNGRAVAGLTKDDFVLTVNGKPQAIDYFDVIVNETATADAPDIAPAQVDLDRRRLMVLLFDTTQSSLQSILRAQKAADDFVRTAPQGDVFAVAVLGRSGVRFAVPFIRDRVAVRHAIATLRSSAASDAFGIATLAAERGAVHSFGDAAVGQSAGNWTAPSLNSGTFFAGSRGAAMHRESLKRMEKFDEDIRTDIRKQATGALSKLAERLAPLSGIKHVVLLSEGGKNLDINQLAQTDQVVQISLVSAVGKLHEKYRAAGVVLDAIDTSLLVAPWPPCIGCNNVPSDPFFSAFSTLHSLSLDTGGSVVRSLPQLRERQRVTYILGFNSRSTAKKNDIQVSVPNAPLFTEVRYRRTFSNDGGAEGADDGLFLADVLLNDIPQRGMTLRLDVGSSPGGTVINAVVPGKELLALGNDTLQLDAFIYVFNEAGEVAEWAYRKSALDLVKGRDALGSEPYTITSRVKLAPGDYVVKVLLRAAESDATGFVRKAFTVN